MSDSQGGTSAGFVALIGAPNAGKSTLMNAMVGTKVSIVTPKVQTTRSRVRGIAMEGSSQIIFIDTPGIFQPKRRLDRAMVSAAWKGAEDGDVLLLLHDCARREIDDDTARIVAQLAESGRRASLVLNKIDLATPERLLERTAELSKMHEFEQVFMISASSGNGIDDLRLACRQDAARPLSFRPGRPVGHADAPPCRRDHAREAVSQPSSGSFPYQLTVETEKWEEQDDGSATVNLSIYVARGASRDHSR